MNKKTLIEKLQHFFDADEKEKIAHIVEIKEVLKLLKQKELSIKEEIIACTNSEEICKLQKSVDVIYAQRHKGVQLIQELK